MEKSLADGYRRQPIAGSAEVPFNIFTPARCRCADQLLGPSPAGKLRSRRHGTLCRRTSGMPRALGLFGVERNRHLAAAYPINNIIQHVWSALEAMDLEKLFLTSSPPLRKWASSR
jgi:hypothetical protein